MMLRAYKPCSRTQAKKFLVWQVGMRFSVYFAQPRAQYIVSHSNFYVNQCFYSDK